MHESQVPNQPPPLEDLDLFGSDAALAEGVEREGGGFAKERLSELGSELGHLNDTVRTELRPYHQRSIEVR